MSDESTRRQPGQSAREEARRRREAAEAGKGWFGRLGARLTDPEGARSWEMGARGEERVGKRLDALTQDGWVVLHDLPIGANGANVDHVALGAGGLFTINTKNTSGRVSVGNKVVFINGRATDHVLKARAEAVRVAKLLGPRVGALDVQPVLVYLADEFSPGDRPLGVAVVHSLGVRRFLRSQRSSLSPTRMTELANALQDPGLWGSQSTSIRTGAAPDRRTGPAVQSRAAASPGATGASSQPPVLAETGLAFVSVWVGAPAGRAVEIVRQARRGAPPLLALMDGDGAHLATADSRTGQISADAEIDEGELEALQRALARELRGW